MFKHRWQKCKKFQNILATRLNVHNYCDSNKIIFRFKFLAEPFFSCNIYNTHIILIINAELLICSFNSDLIYNNFALTFDIVLVIEELSWQLVRSHHASSFKKCIENWIIAISQSCLINGRPDMKSPRINYHLNPIIGWFVERGVSMRATPCHAVRTLTRVRTRACIAYALVRYVA